ncbi:MAG: CPBP family intramembrane metalloprotease [Tyzzerella sp.]|nr:CPBP family intramembrane metalloprotease [Tyzzerella sp.]
MQKRDVLRHVGIIVLLSVSVSVGLNILLLLINLPQYSEQYQKVSEILYAPPIWQQLLTSGLLIPIVEEVIFRGLGFRLLRRWIPFSWAMVISAVAFGAYHGNLVQFVYAGFCGVLLAYFYEKYQTILAPILSHAVMNIVAIVLTQTGIFADILKRGIVAFMVMLFCDVCGMALFLRLQKMDVTKVLKMCCKD